MNNFDESSLRRSLPAESYTNVLLPDDAPVTPDNPPWGLGAGIGLWLLSVLLLILVPLLVVAPYLVYLKWQGGGIDLTALERDPMVLALSLAGTIPAHLLTFLVAWRLVTDKGKRPFESLLGLQNNGWQEFAVCIGLALALFMAGNVIIYFLGNGQQTALEAVLYSSPLARYLGAFLAAVTAPLVEEVVYRGVLFGGIRKASGSKGLAVVLVTFLFALVHTQQYFTNPAVILVILLLSLVLTTVRAVTGRLLPCIIIHAVFNGIQAVLLALGMNVEKAQEAAQPAAFVLQLFQ